MIRQAIIPLAGLGTRLLPLTSIFPKELLPISGRPGLEYILDECIKSGITQVILIISTKTMRFFSLGEQILIEQPKKKTIMPI